MPYGITNSSILLNCYENNEAKIMHCTYFCNYYFKKYDIYQQILYGINLTHLFY